MKTYSTRRAFFYKLVLATCCLFFTQAPCIAAPRAVRSLLEIRQQKVVIQKFDLSCGAAALATLLRYQFNDKVTEHQIASAMIRRDDYLADPDRVRQQQGFSLLDLKQYVQQRGYDAAGLRGMTLDDLVQSAPLMVPLNLHGYQHFVVFRGIVDDDVMLADPAWGNRSMPTESFLSAWVDEPEVGGIGFVVTKPNHTTPNNHLAPRADDGVLLK